LLPAAGQRREGNEERGSLGSGFRGREKKEKERGKEGKTASTSILLGPSNRKKRKGREEEVVVGPGEKREGSHHWRGAKDADHRAYIYVGYLLRGEKKRAPMRKRRRGGTQLFNANILIADYKEKEKKKGERVAVDGRGEGRDDAHSLRFSRRAMAYRKASERIRKRIAVF